MRIIPIANESFGVRSMATFVETEEIGVCIDPGVSLAPRRYGLPPHPIEIERRDNCWREIKERVKQSSILIVTHYHYDHYEPKEPEIYGGKQVLLKHPTSMINKSQKWRSAYFLSRLRDLPKKIVFVDGVEVAIGDTTIRFSKPVFHGTNPRLGYVIEVSIVEGDERFVFTSDVEGPSIQDQVEFILQENPQTLLVDGPMTYLLGYRYSAESLDVARQNLIRIIGHTDVSTVIIDHHFMRDLAYRSEISQVYEDAREKGVRVISAAEYVGRPIEMLEARRKELFEQHPVK